MRAARRLYQILPQLSRADTRPWRAGDSDADANCAGSITNFDIDGFAIGLVQGGSAPPPAEYLLTGATAACWNLRGSWGDVNHDSLFNNFDIDPFVACLISLPPAGTGCP